MTLDQAIRDAAEKLTQAGLSTARLDAELLLSGILGKDRAWIFTHGRQVLASGPEKLFLAQIERRAGREPLQYIVGKQEFWGLEFTVTPDVLIPRPETELLVEAGIGHLRRTPKGAIIDLCTGSGCIAVCLAKEFGAARIFATDRSTRALAIARKNARNLDVAQNIRFLEGDLFDALRELDLAGTIDLITANPPYIRTADLPGLQPEVKEHEPEMALIAGPEGTEIHERIVSEAGGFLKKGGALIMEMGLGQADAIAHLIDAAGCYSRPEIRKDLAGIDRVIIARRK